MSEHKHVKQVVRIIRGLRRRIHYVYILLKMSDERMDRLAADDRFLQKHIADLSKIVADMGDTGSKAGMCLQNLNARIHYLELQLYGKTVVTPPPQEEVERWGKLLPK